MHERQTKELETCLPMYRGTIQKAYEVDCSPRSAIKAMCLYCTGYERVAVRDCTAFACPLHAYRPFTKAAQKVKRVPEPSDI